MFRLRIDKNKAWVEQRETLTLYTEGSELVEIDLDFSEDWDDLSKIAVFRAYDAQIDIAMTGDSVEIPVSVLLQPNVHLYFGVYGVGGSGSVVISTIWADLGIVQASPNPTDAGNYGPPDLGLYEQLSALVTAAAAAAQTAATGVYAGDVSFSINSSGHLIMSVTDGGTTTETDMGAVTAYAAAVAGGYTGTYAQFQALLTANYATSQTVAALESDVATAKSNAATALSTAQSASSAASAASTAASAAQTAVAGKQAKAKKATANLISGNSSWSGINVEGVTATNIVLWGPDPSSFLEAQDKQVRMTAQGAGTVSFTAEAATESAITMNLLIFDV